MKKILAILVITLLGAVGLSACSNGEQTIKDKQALLAEQKFSIASLNGTTFSSMQDHSQYIQFDKELLITGQICNNFRATAVLKDDSLVVSELSSTKMLCSDEVNAIEEAFFTLLRQGAVVKVEAETLTLSTQPADKQSEAGEGDVPQEIYTFVLHRESSTAQ